MLKTKRGSDTYLITQPAHAELAGTIAAHWGNAEFTRPGYFAASSDPERVRREVILAIEQHDNGWWEWEAAPSISDADDMPEGLPEVLKDPVAGMQRWRLGIPRLADLHPYASLLISDHAWWLYAAQFNDDSPAEFTHQLQQNRQTYPAELRPHAEQFLSDIRDLQHRFQAAIVKDQVWREAIEPEQRNPHIRLLQTLDAVSLALCSNVLAPGSGLGEDSIVFHDVPRRDWSDRVKVKFIPHGAGQIALDPYPFDISPLTISVPVRVVPSGAWWRETPLSVLSFTFIRA
jgi:hypothetical protein